MREAVEELLREIVDVAVQKAEDERDLKHFQQRIAPFIDDSRKPARYMEEKLAKLKLQALAQFENVGLDNLKRSQPDSICEEEVCKPLVKVKTISVAPSSSSSIVFSSASKNQREESAKKRSRLEQEKLELELARSKQKELSQLRDYTPCVQKSSKPCLQDKSGDAKGSSGPRHSKTGSVEFQHISVVVDKLDVCNCPEHCRVSMSLCRKSKRNSTPLQAVNERDDAEEETPLGSQERTSKTFDIERLPQYQSFDVELKTRQWPN